MFYPRAVRHVARLVPELDVTNLETSVSFYVEVGGFSVVYERSEERFAYLARPGAELMLQEASGPGRRFRTAPLERPFGRGINLQIQVEDATSVSGRVIDFGLTPIVPLEERWYRAGDVALGQRQLVVADPDGYLIRFAEDLGQRPWGQGDARAADAQCR